MTACSIRPCAKTRKGRWYRRGTRSQVQRPWIIALPFKVEFRPGEGRLAQDFNEVLAWLGGIAGLLLLLPQHRQRMIEHFIRAAEVTAANLLLDDPLLFVLEVDRNAFKLRYMHLPVKPSIRMLQFLGSFCIKFRIIDTASQIASGTWQYPARSSQAQPDGV